MKTIQKMYDHLNWANQRILGTLQSIEGENQEVRRLFYHILFAEKIWITRVQGKDSSRLPLWSDVDIEVCSELVKQNEDSSTALLSRLENTDLENLISYTNSKGTEFKNSLRDILTHIALHGQYHRGQINARLRADGNEPVDVDFITFVR